jgi:phosphohistidine phosphatase
VLQLLVMRHAKSDWNASFSDDHERPLAPRGVLAARLMGRFLSASGHAPELVLTSTAVRARTTVELAAAAGEWSSPVTATRSFYAAGPVSVLERLGECDGPERVLVAGHEPTWSALVAMLTGGGRVRMPTAAVACVAFTARRWAEVEAGAGQLGWLVTPKLLKKAVKE